MIALQHAATVDEVYTVGNTRSLPRVFDIEGLQQTTLQQVECGEDFSLALSANGELYAWGDANYGKLAAPASAEMPTDDDNLPYQPLPERVHGFGGCRIVQLACGSNHSLALTEGGRVWAWGGAVFGRLGPADISSMPLDEDGDPFQPEPVRVDGFGEHRLSFIACGNIHNLAVTREGLVFAWGGAHYGLLGIADAEGNERLESLPRDEGSGQPFQPQPSILDAMSSEVVVQVSCGSAHNFAVTQEGEVWAWGGAKYGRLGLPLKQLESMPTDEDGDPYQPRPVKLNTFPKFTRIRIAACGEWHSLCLSDDGSLFAFGSAEKGRLGLADKKLFQKYDEFDIVPTPQRVLGFEGKKVTNISASAYFSLALIEGGDLWAWGQTAAGWLSVSCTQHVGTPEYQPTPAFLNLAPRTHVMPAALRLTHEAPLLVIVSKERWQCPAAELGMRGLALPLLQGFALSEEFSDMVVRVGEKTMRAHRVVLAGASQFFRDKIVAFPSQADETGSYGELVLSDVDVVTVKTLLKYCYNGHDEGLVNEENALALLAASHVCQLSTLKEICAQFLLFHLTQDNALNVLMHADRFNVPELGGRCIQYIVHHLRSFKECPEFSNLPRHLVQAIRNRATQKINECLSKKQRVV